MALLYFSGHGVKDVNGRLYLALANTNRKNLRFTGLSASQLNDALEDSLSRRKIVILDCCYSGAFPEGFGAKADPDMHTLERLQGQGRVVMTASDAASYSFEGDSITGRAVQSVFTECLIEGLRSGAADLDNDGDITASELYDYVSDSVAEKLPQQRPKMQQNVRGSLVLARNVSWAPPTLPQIQPLNPMPRRYKDPGNKFTVPNWHEKWARWDKKRREGILACLHPLLDLPRAGTIAGGVAHFGPDFDERTLDKLKSAISELEELYERRKLQEFPSLVEFPEFPELSELLCVLRLGKHLLAFTTEGLLATGLPRKDQPWQMSYVALSETSIRTGTAYNFASDSKYGSVEVPTVRVGKLPIFYEESTDLTAETLALVLRNLSDLFANVR